MSMRYQAGILTASYFPLKTPDAPTAVTATAGNNQASVAFTAPSNVGGGAITSYLVVVTDSSSGATFTNTGASSPIVVTGLTNGNNYTARVSATNGFGTSPFSANSNSFSPTNAGQQAYTTAGTYSWVAPAGVTSVSVVAVGAGGGCCPYYGTAGGGGGLGYKNNYSVTPGNSYTVVVGAGGSPNVNFTSNFPGTPGGDSYFISTSVVMGGGGLGGPNSTSGGTTLGGTYTGDGGGNGGGHNDAYAFGGGGGAGGYSGTGGKGSATTTAYAGAGGGGAGGINNSSSQGQGGGGVGLLGQGTSGTTASQGGSGGANGGLWGGSPGRTTPAGGAYGGGAGYSGGTSNGGGTGGVGAVRIIWPGTSRSFPSTNTGDM